MPQDLRDRPTRMPTLMLVLAVIGVFGTGIDGEFVWDDRAGLLDNWSYRGPAREALHFAFTTTALGHWQPLTWLTFTVDHALWGMDPRGFRLTNLVVHAAAALAVMAMSRELLRLAYPAATPFARAWGACLAAALFAVHPLRVESVCWAIERRDLLSCAGLAAAVWAYLVADRAAHPNYWRALSVAFYALSLLSKAWGVSLVAVLVAIDHYPLRRVPWGSLVVRKLPYVALAIPVALVARFAQQSAGAMADWSAYPMERRIAQAIYGIAFYPWKSIAPIGLSPLYELDGANAPIWAARHAAGGVAVIFATVACLAAFRRSRAPLVAWVCYLALISPVLGFFQSGMQEVADRYAVISMLPFAVLVAGGAMGLGARGPGAQRAVIAASVAVLSGLGALSIRQIGYWNDEHSLWERVIEIQPSSWMGHHGLGLAHYQVGRDDLALPLLVQAAAMSDHVECHAALGMVRLRAGWPADAARDLDRAIAIAPDHAPSRYHRALARRALGDRAGELLDLARATASAPKAWKPWGAYARALADAGRATEAALAFDRALALAPEVAREGLARQRALSLGR